MLPIVQLILTVNFVLVLEYAFCVLIIFLLIMLEVSIVQVIPSIKCIIVNGFLLQPNQLLLQMHRLVNKYTYPCLKLILPKRLQILWLPLEISNLMTGLPQQLVMKSDFGLIQNMILLTKDGLGLIQMGLELLLED